MSVMISPRYFRHTIAERGALVFRFLKRTMKGLHLISTSQEGVTIQFYVLLVVALLELRLKQETVATYEASQPRPPEPTGETPRIPGLMIITTNATATSRVCT